jgi:hypothetical protein
MLPHPSSAPRQPVLKASERASSLQIGACMRACVRACMRTWNTVEHWRRSHTSV